MWNINDVEVVKFDSRYNYSGTIRFELTHKPSGIKISSGSTFSENRLFHLRKEAENRLYNLVMEYYAKLYYSMLLQIKEDAFATEDAGDFTLGIQDLLKDLK